MQKVGLVTDEGAFNTFGVEFVPFCSRVFFPINTSSTYDTPESMNDEEFTMLSKKVYGAADVEERVALLDEFFLKQ